MLRKCFPSQSVASLRHRQSTARQLKGQGRSTVIRTRLIEDRGGWLCTQKGGTRVIRGWSVRHSCGKHGRKLGWEGGGGECHG